VNGNIQEREEGGGGGLKMSADPGGVEKKYTLRRENNWVKGGKVGYTRDIMTSGRKSLAKERGGISHKAWGDRE